MVKMRVQVLSNKFPARAGGLRQKLLQASWRHAEKVLQAAKEEVPVRTGALRDSGHIEMAGTRADVIFDAPYAVYVHNGTSRQAPNPFLSRAVDREGDSLITSVEEIARWLEG